MEPVQRTIDHRRATDPRGLIYVAETAFLVLFGCAVATIVIRRLVGALEQPLGPLALLLVGCLLASAVIIFTRNKPSVQQPPISADWQTIGLTVLVILLALSVSLPGSPGWAMVLFWTVVLSALGKCWVGKLAWMAEEHGDRQQAAEDVGEHISQQVRRETQADGNEIITGLLRCDMMAQERSKPVHVAFCPPLGATPQVEFDQVAGPPATVKATQIESFGARFDVKLDALPDTSSSVLIEFFARACQ